MMLPVGEIFCDWLDATYAPDSSVLNDVSTFVTENGGECTHGNDKRKVYRFGSDVYKGTLVLENASRYSRVSASGAALMHLRCLDLYLELISIMSTEAHNVSRLDLARDELQDGAEMIRSMKRKYNQKGVTCALGRKSLPVSYVTSVRADGKETGTFYAGHHTRARITGRVYDKQAQMLAVHGEHIPPTVRTEITVRGENGRPGPNLYDAIHPEKLFWHVASPVLLKAPVGVQEWISGWGGSWVYEMPEKLLPAESLARMVEYSPALDDLLVQADKINGDGGRKYLMRLLSRKFGLDTIH